MKNILIFTAGYTGDMLLEQLKKLRLTPFIATTSKSELRKNNTGNISAFNKDFQIFEVSYEHYDFSKNILPAVDAVICVDWKKDYFAGSFLNTPVYYMQPSLLPKYRGYGAVSQQLLNGVIYSGITIYEYSGIIDAGDILYQKEIKIEDYYMASDFIKETAKETALFIKDFISGKEFIKHPQNNSLAFYLPKLRKSSKMIDFNASSYFVYNFIRAYTYPYSMAVFHYKGKEYKVASASIESWSGIEGKPGEIVQQNDYGIITACGDGSILIKEIVYDNKVMHPKMLNAFEGDMLL